MPNSPNRKRGRIGLTLAPDVMDILDEHGRSIDSAPDDPRLTRTQIIEIAVRQWAAARAVPKYPAQLKAK